VKALDDWFEHQAARERRAVYLEDALLGDRFAAYSYYRLRYFLGRSALTVALHLAEFLLLALTFRHQLAAAVLVRVGCVLVTAWWWGALEVLRAQVRTLRRERQTEQLRRRLGQWLGLGAACAALTLVGTSAWLVHDAAQAGFGVFHLYVLASAVRLALGFWTRTYHAGVYALRRVYRPFLAVAGVDLLAFAGTLALWPVLGAWSFPCLLLTTGILQHALTFVYVRRLYRFLDLLPATSLRLWRAVGLVRPAPVRDFVLAGFASALTKVDTLLVLALAGAARSEGGPWRQLLLVFYLIGPLVHAAHEWAQLFYFDLKRLDVEILAHFRRRFERLVGRLAWLVGGACWLLSCVCAAVFLRPGGGPAALAIGAAALGAFFVLRARLAFFQTRAFAEGRYRALIGSGLLLLVGPVLAQVLALPGGVAPAVFVGLLLGTLLLLGGRRLRLVPDAVGPVPAQEWLTSLAEQTGPVRLGSVTVARQAAFGQVARLAAELAHALQGRGALTYLGDRCLAWFERPQRGELSEAHVLTQGAGLIESVQTATAADGRTAPRVARREGLWPALPADACNLPVALDAAALKARFGEFFPTGIIYDPADSDQAPALSAADRREVLRAALQHANNVFRVPRRARFDVSTLLLHGTIRCLFLVPWAESKRLRREWRTLLGAANLQAAAFGERGTLAL
jgi:hypothetical protein